MPHTIQNIKCPSCGQSVNERKITLFKDMVTTLRAVYMWCGKESRHEFRRKDIRHLFLTENESARFGDWVYFGGILYKHGKGHWGMNMHRAKAFLNGETAINTLCIKNPLSGEHELRDPRTVKEIKGLESFLDFQGNFVPEYMETLV